MIYSSTKNLNLKKNPLISLLCNKTRIEFVVHYPVNFLESSNKNLTRQEFIVTGFGGGGDRVVLSHTICCDDENR